MTTGHLNRLERIRDLLRAGGKSGAGSARLLLFSGTGFNDALVEKAETTHLFMALTARHRLMKKTIPNGHTRRVVQHAHPRPSRADRADVTTPSRDFGKTVSRIPDQARARKPGSPGGLVVLAACTSDLTVADYDEALTLSSAFLAAGAVGVIGARWEASDLLTAFPMFMLHRHLVENPDESPACALRAA